MTHYSDFEESNNKYLKEKNIKNQHDSVNHPSHYVNSPSGIETIQITEHMNFCRGNAIKYIMRAGVKDKNKEIEDLKKAIWYINREIERLQKRGE